MDEIIATQHDRAKPLTGKTFLLSAAAIVLRLAAAQIVVNLAILMTGTDMLSVLFYVYAAWLLWNFLHHAAASHIYTLKTRTLVLQRRMGDCTTKQIEIPLSEVCAIRPVRKGESMRLYDRRVNFVDPACRPPLRVRAGFALSLVSAHAARAAAGKRVSEQTGHAVFYEENGVRRCCVFKPNEKFCAALEAACGGAFGADEFAGRRPLDSVYARCLQRAFPALYPHVKPLMDPQEVEAAKAELAARKAARKAKKEVPKPAAQKALQNAEPQKRRRSASKEPQHNQAAKPSGRSRKKSGEKHEVHDDTV